MEKGSRRGGERTAPRDFLREVERSESAEPRRPVVVKALSRSCAARRSRASKSIGWALTPSTGQAERTTAVLPLVNKGLRKLYRNPVASPTRMSGLHAEGKPVDDTKTIKFQLVRNPFPESASARTGAAALDPPHSGTLSSSASDTPQRTSQRRQRPRTSSELQSSLQPFPVDKR